MRVLATCWYVAITKDSMIACIGFVDLGYMYQVLAFFCHLYIPSIALLLKSKDVPLLRLTTINCKVRRREAVYMPIERMTLELRTARKDCCVHYNERLLLVDDLRQ